jgi:2-oxoglutarate ferredoxin oxidoreductase subunit alpha
MMKHLPAFGGNVVQAEDEIAAIASCLGASYAGAKAMTATSGPGLALMSELIGMASISEIPVVVVDVMRSGPGTGMPTKTEQADLMFAIHGSSGEAPRIVLAATGIDDCFHQAINAFNLAERYQTPVILLSDQSMGYRTRTLSTPDFTGLTLANRTAPDAEALADYQRFLDGRDSEPRAVNLICSLQMRFTLHVAVMKKRLVRQMTGTPQDIPQEG